MTAGTPRSVLAYAASEVKSVFLPSGYPGSVRDEYLTFQMYDTLQAACSYLRNVLTTSAVLKAAGVGNEAASPMAAALTWVLRDGFGMFGSLLFSYGAGANFDIYVKEWRLFADLINDVGLSLDMLAPLSGSWYMYTVALAALCKTVCGMVAGACRASITAHFALRGNLADVSAKENAQETAVNLLGLVLGSFVAKTMGDSSSLAWASFGLLTVLHVWANWKGVGCLTFDHLNPQRAVLVTRAWWKEEGGTTRGSSASSGSSEPGGRLQSLSMAPRSVARMERIWGPLHLWWSGPRLGVGLAALVDVRSDDGGAAAALRELDEIFTKEKYLLRLDRHGRPQVAFKATADDETALRALFHGAALTRGHPGTAPAPPRRSTAAARRGTGLAEGEAQALRETLGLCQAQWPRFKEVLLETGGVPSSQGPGAAWRAAAVPIAHFGSRRVHIGGL